MKGQPTHMNTNAVVLPADPMLAHIVPRDAKLQKLADGFGFTEGPVWTGADGCVFSDIPNNMILRWNPEGTVSKVIGPESGIRGAKAIFTAPAREVSGSFLPRESTLEH